MIDEVFATNVATARAGSDIGVFADAALYAIKAA
jgi:hypothetical protein